MEELFTVSCYLWSEKGIAHMEPTAIVWPAISEAYIGLQNRRRQPVMVCYLAALAQENAEKKWRRGSI